MPASDAAVLRRLRTFCLALPDVSETTTFGHPTFQVAGRTFAVLERYRGRLCIVFKTEMLHQQALVEDDARFRVAPYIGRLGWVSMLADLKLDWREVRRLVTGSHRLVRETKTRARGRPLVEGLAVRKRGRRHRTRGLRVDIHGPIPLGRERRSGGREPTSRCSPTCSSRDKSVDRCGR